MVQPLSPLWIWGAIVLAFVAIAFVAAAFKRSHRREILMCPVRHVAYSVDSIWADGPAAPSSRVDIEHCAFFGSGRVTCKRRCLAGPNIRELRQAQAGAYCYQHPLVAAGPVVERTVYVVEEQATDTLAVHRHAPIHA